MCIKRIKMGIKSIVELTKRLFPEAASGAEVVAPEKLKAKKEPYVGRMVRTSRGGHNMPRYQPCPQCHADSKRREKTRGGANYWCRKCKTSFLVTFPGMKRARRG